MMEAPIHPPMSGSRVEKLVCLYFLFAVLLDGVAADGWLRGSSGSAKVTAVDEASASDIFRKLKPGQIVELAFDDLRLSEAWRIDVHNVTLRGAPNRLKPVVRCPQLDTALYISATNVWVENIIFMDCLDVPTVVTVKPLDPPINDEVSIMVTFDQVEFRRNIIQPADRFADGVDAALHIGEGASVMIVTCNFADNRSTRGGAIHMKRGLLSVHNSTFANNTAHALGGAISVDQQIASNTNIGVLISNCSFRENEVLSSVGNKMGRPLEPFQHYFFGNADGQGGAVRIKEVVQTIIEHSQFENNAATMGGALHVSMKDRLTGQRKGLMLIRNCSFVGNHATFADKGDDQDPDLLQGGAIFMSIGDSNMDVSFSECRITDNRAVFGGGLHMVTTEKNKVRVDSCVFARNVAVRAGGGALFRNVGHLRWVASNVTASSAELGGGVLLTNNAQMSIVGPSMMEGTSPGDQKSVFQGNRAIDGAGLLCLFCASANLRGARFINNTASRHGGGVGLLNAAGDVAIQEAVFERNVAEEGGGAYVDSTSSFRLAAVAAEEKSPNTRFSGNKAVSGGGLHVTARSLLKNQIEIQGVQFVGNAAVELAEIRGELQYNEGVVMQSDYTKRWLHAAQNLTRTGVSQGSLGMCGPGGGGGFCLHVNEIPGSAIANVVIEDILFERNSASIGGGMFVAISGSDWQSGECKQRISPSAFPCRSFKLSDGSFVGNAAVFGGGAAFVTDPTSIFLACSTSPFTFLSFDKVLQDGKETEVCLKVEDNSVQSGGVEYRPQVASKAVEVEFLPESSNVTSPPEVATTPPIFIDGALPPPIQVNTSSEIRAKVVDGFGNAIGGVVPNTCLKQCVMESPTCQLRLTD
ncbi:hypothetical protein BSKO_05737 [Bryopsis sp. KO-2023]|nr:hypothetical protein BSKO_05737 [Bryopsis sp. KO-2023]